MSLENLGSFKQGDSNKNKTQESGGEIGISNDMARAPSLSTGAGQEIKNATHPNLEADEEEIAAPKSKRNRRKKGKKGKGKEAASQAVVDNPNWRLPAPRLVNLGNPTKTLVVGAPAIHLQHQQHQLQLQQQQTSYFPPDHSSSSIHHPNTAYGFPSQPQPQPIPVRPTWLHSRDYSKNSSVDSAPVKGQNDYSSTLR